MRVFLAVIKMNLKIIVQYKWSLLISIFADPFVILINISLFTSIYRYNKTNSILGYSLNQMIWYFTGVLFIWYITCNLTDWNMAAKILSGDLVMDLLKPLSVLKLEFANAVALRICGILFEFIPGMIVYSLILYPDFMTVFSMLRFLAVVVMSFILFFLINFLVGLSAFVIKSNFSLQSLKSIIFSLTAGAYIPLEFFPKWLNTINNFLPFQYLFYWPIQFFINRGDTGKAYTFFRILGIQALWIIFLFILCRVLWKQAIKKFCAVGG